MNLSFVAEQLRTMISFAGSDQQERFCCEVASQVQHSPVVEARLCTTPPPDYAAFDAACGSPTYASRSATVADRHTLLLYPPPRCGTAPLGARSPRPVRVTGNRAPSTEICSISALRAGAVPVECVSAATPISKRTWARTRNRFESAKDRLHIPRVAPRTRPHQIMQSACAHSNRQSGVCLAHSHAQST
jgi:hypothetical protein